MFPLKEFFLKNCRKYLLFAISFAVFILHSFFILRYYLKYEKFESTSTELQWPMEPPEMTVCNNKVVSSVVAGTKSIYSKRNEMEYIRVLSFAKQQYFLEENQPFSGIVNNCQFTDYNIPCRKYKHFNYFYGECETISVGDKPNSDIPITGIKLDGSVNEEFAYQFQRLPSFVLLFHNPGTPPIFRRENLIFGNSYGDYVIHLKKKIVNRIDCFQEEDVINREIPGIKNKTKYSYESCLTSCYQNFTMSQCGCILPHFYFAENDYRYPVCKMCRGDFTLDLSLMCNCKPLCRDVAWGWSVEDAKYINEIEPLKTNSKPPDLYQSPEESRRHKKQREKNNQVKSNPNFENDYDFRQSLEKPKVSKTGTGNGKRRQPKSTPTFKITVDYETARVTIVNEQLMMDKVGLISTIGGSICLCFGTYLIRALQLIVLELFGFLSETKRKINLIYRNKPFFSIRRVVVVVKQWLWLIPTIILTILSVFLIVDLTKNYLNFFTLQHSSIGWNRNFLAVTVCSGVPVSWNKYNNQSEFIRQLVSDMEAVYEEHAPLAISSPNLQETEYYNILHHKLQIGSKKEREENGLKMEEYIKKCTWSYSGLSYNCSEAQFVQFNNHKYGNCATFNHGSLILADSSGLIDDVEMALSFNQLEVPVGRSGSAGIMVHLHERGTAPLFTPSTTHLIRAFSFNHIAFTAEKHVASAHNCSRGEDAEMREKSVYQDQRRQYLHTFESCLESCFQKITHEEPRCRSCYQPLMLGKYDVDRENECTTFCPFIEEVLLADKCNCKRNCGSIEYKTQISASNFSKMAKNSYKVYNNRGYLDFTIDGHYETYNKFTHYYTVKRRIFPDGNCGFKVSAQKDFEKMFNETTKTKFANVLGLIGGVMGFLQALLYIFRSLRIFVTRGPY